MATLVQQAAARHDKGEPPNYPPPVPATPTKPPAKKPRKDAPPIPRKRAFEILPAPKLENTASLSKKQARKEDFMLHLGILRTMPLTVDEQRALPSFMEWFNNQQKTHRDTAANRKVIFCNNF